LDTQPEQILIQLQRQGIISSQCVLGERMPGTTEGRVYFIYIQDQPVYVLKMDAPMYIKTVTDFLQTYKGGLIPKLHYIDPANAYFIYEHVTGSIYKSKVSKSKWLIALSESLINRYVRVSPSKGWGWLDEPLFDSWHDLLKQSIIEARIKIGDLLTEADHQLVLGIPKAIYGSDQLEAYLLHGDCGVHNFIFDSAVLRGVIDPTPMIGPPLHDFFFAFCSSPDELTMDTLLESLGSFDCPLIQKAVDQRFLIDEVLVHLYCRIGTCLKYHSHQLSDYMDAWTYWRKLKIDEE
jgi:hypothetical protein